MRYSYTNTTQVPLMMEVTLHDITTLIDILVPVAADEGHDNQWQAASFVRFLRETHAKACDTVADDIAYERKRTERTE